MDEERKISMQRWGAKGNSLFPMYWQGQEQCRGPSLCVQSPGGMHSSTPCYPEAESNAGENQGTPISYELDNALRISCTEPALCSLAIEN